MKNVLIVGELNVDLIMAGGRFPEAGKEVLVDDFFMTLGSASAISAAGLAKLGTPATLLTKIGPDPWGEFCVRSLETAGVDVSHIIREPTIKTGIAISISTPQDRALVTYLGSINAMCLEDVPLLVLPNYDHLHVSSYFLQERLRPRVRELFAHAHRAGLTTSLDPGFDPSNQWGHDLLETLADVDIFLPNEIELTGVTGESEPAKALKVLQNGHTRIVAKLGARGAMAMDERTTIAIPAFPIKPVDTTGAGDSFNAGYIYAYLQGLTARECLRYGAACGALSTRGLGGTTTQADLKTLRAFLQV